MWSPPLLDARNCLTQSDRSQCVTGLSVKNRISDGGEWADGWGEWGGGVETKWWRGFVPPELSFAGRNENKGNFRFEYASDNGLAAGEVIEPDGTRLGAYQYKDPSGQIVKLKYRAGKDGFQILEGSHVPKSVEPQASLRPEGNYKQGYEQQRRQYELQQDHDRMKLQQPWSGQSQRYLGESGVAPPARAQYSLQSWHGGGASDDGQYRENYLEENSKDKAPHNFGKGYAFSFEDLYKIELRGLDLNSLLRVLRNLNQERNQEEPEEEEGIHMKER
ncbi:hypothetical protein EVAR_82053_1 [Eumeta japonica]|uniref:Cuticle protein 6 n=1 Tax=Eumeta variegata TaxID=151549 RepID=A0A4C1XKL4_EUMVA|nr:hypothetical protein EVAR_82053_1 [Eumeta japonica]